jgi:uncharacterized protein (TIGR02453 family)
LTQKIPPFEGFSKETFKFLTDLENNNTIKWFNENKDRYQENLVKPAKAFVQELAPFLNQLNPAIRSEPKFNKTLMRLNKDMRFAKGAPYRTYFLIHFGRFKMDSEFFVYFSPGEYQIGMFLNNTNGDGLHFKENFQNHKKEIREVFKQYELDNKYSLYKLQKEPVRIKAKFDSSKHIDLFEDLDYILLQKVNQPGLSKVYSGNFIVETIKIISALYPIYCFAISPQPLKELEKFEQNFGKIIE